MSDNWFMFALHFFLSLFPVFTLSTNFPIIALTLSNNLKSLFLSEHRSHNWFTRTVLFPLLALIPPTCVAMTTNSLEFLVGITGSYAGAGIQYIVPAALVYYARKVRGFFSNSRTYSRSFLTRKVFPDFYCKRKSWLDLLFLIFIMLGIILS